MADNGFSCFFVINYVDKTLLVLSATNGGVSIVSFVIVISVTVKVISLGLSLIFCYSYGVDKKEKERQQNCFIRKKEGK